MSFVTEIKTFAALGSGVIGSGWIARALEWAVQGLAKAGTLSIIGVYAEDSR
ncbi:hypothetical protein HKT24_22325, partial [Pseudomonas aeruginosa]|nr:hypothetical protein [Pseudomonas aeruginosa]